jgi:hypothetical protein
MVHCLWNQDDEIFFGAKVMQLVVLLIFFIMIQFQIELKNKLGWLVLKRLKIGL